MLKLVGRSIPRDKTRPPSKVQTKRQREAAIGRKAVEHRQAKDENKAKNKAKWNKKQKLKARDKSRQACHARVVAADEAEGSEDEAEESPSVEMLVPPSQGANGTISVFWHASLRNLCCHGHHCFH